MPTQDQLIPVVFAFINALTQSESQQLLETHLDLLLSDAAEQLLANWLEQSQNNIEATRVLQERQALLARYREASKRVVQEPKPSELRCVRPSPELIEAVLAFVNADSGAERKGLVLARGDLLLSDAADQLLADWVSQSKGNAEYTRVLQECRTLLARYRHEATSHKPPQPPKEKKIRELVLSFINAETKKERQRIVLTNRELLLSDSTEQVLADQVEKFKNDAVLSASFKWFRAFLACCRREEVEVEACLQIHSILFSVVQTSNWESMLRNDLENRELLLSETTSWFLAELLELFKDDGEVSGKLKMCQGLLSFCHRYRIGVVFAVSIFIEANSWAERQRLVDVYRELLLDEMADQFLAESLEFSKNNIELTRWLETTRALLASCRDQGIDLVTAVWAFIGANTWQDRQHVVETQQEFLLNEAADQVLADLLSQFRDNTDMTRLLEFGRALLVQSRNQGIQAAFAQLQRRNRLAEVMRTFVSATSWEELQQYVFANRELLLSQETDQLLAEWLLEETSKGDANAIQQLKTHRFLLARCRREGIEVAFEITKGVAALLTASSWAECKRRVEAQAELLLSEAADQVLADMLEMIEDERFGFLLQEYRKLLARCRREEIDAAFADYLRPPTLELLARLTLAQEEEEQIQFLAKHPELFPLFQRGIQGPIPDELDALVIELLRPAHPNHMSRREKMCQAALALVERDDQPLLWAWLQTMLGKSYLQNPLGTQGLNYEQAIDHLKQALKVYTPQAYPKQWAMIQYSLVAAYYRRIRGNRAENIEQTIHHSQQALKVYTHDAFPEEWADIQNNLALAYTNRIRGEWVLNLEKAIRHLKQAQKVRTRQAAPNEWAIIQNHLGNAYYRRIRGERAENIEQAIYYYQQSLEVLEAFSEQWAMIQMGLGNAYTDRIRGEKADNIEQALEHYQQALKVHTRESDPNQWATIHNNMSDAYQKRIYGEEADNLEQAIRCCEQALQAYTQDAFPDQRAETHFNLGAFYAQRREKGERAKNIEKAIYHSQKALEVYTREVFPAQWAKVHSNLGNAYGEYKQHDRADSIEKAINHFEQALQVITPQRDPMAWAQIQSNLGYAYIERVRGEQALNIEEAIRHLEQALQVYTPQQYPERWSRIQHRLCLAYMDRIRGIRAENIEQAINHAKQAVSICEKYGFKKKYWAVTHQSLAICYRNRVKGEKADNIEQAISHYQQALSVYTRQEYRQEWADIQNNLAVAHRERIPGTSENIKQAIHHAKQALEVYTRQAFPVNWAMTQVNLGSAYLNYANLMPSEKFDEQMEKVFYHYCQALEVYKPQLFPQACRDIANVLGQMLYMQKPVAETREILTTAHLAVENLRGEAKRDESKRNLSEENAALYARLVHCCLIEGDENAAFEYAVAGKGRAFVDMLASTRFNMAEAKANDPQLAADLRPWRKLRQEIDHLLTQLTGHSSNTPDAKRHQQELLKELRHKQRAEGQLWEDLAYKYPALTATQSAPRLNAEQAKTLATELSATLVEFVQHAGGWSAFVVTPEAVRHVPLGEVDNKFRQDMVVDWLEKVGQPKYHNQESYDTLSEWYDVLIAPLSLPPTGKFVLAPASFLHFIPLSIARHPDTERYLCDDYQITFTPNLAALRVSLFKAQKNNQTLTSGPLQTLLTAAYPGNPKWRNHPDAKVRRRYLPNVISEAKAIATHFPHVIPLHADKATPQAVVDHAKNKEVVHFSCHGSFDPELPEQSGLVLFDGWLTVQRIITELHLTQTRLATLSACQTHLTRANAGEEHTGLVQALMTAGAKSVVASLWSVEERSTRALFEHFYSAIANGEPPASALQQAMRHVRQQPKWKHPFYWAAFQVSGLGF